MEAGLSDVDGTGAGAQANFRRRGVPNGLLVDWKVRMHTAERCLCVKLESSAAGHSQADAAIRALQVEISANAAPISNRTVEHSRSNTRIDLYQFNRTVRHVNVGRSSRLRQAQRTIRN
jgi:hypothetical protein